MVKFDIFLLKWGYNYLVSDRFEFSVLGGVS